LTTTQCAGKFIKTPPVWPYGIYRWTTLGISRLRGGLWTNIHSEIQAELHTVTAV